MPVTGNVEGEFRAEVRGTHWSLQKVTRKREIKYAPPQFDTTVDIAWLDSTSGGRSAGLMMPLTIFSGAAENFLRPHAVLDLETPSEVEEIVTGAIGVAMDAALKTGIGIAPKDLDAIKLGAASAVSYIRQHKLGR